MSALFEIDRLSACATARRRRCATSRCNSTAGGLVTVIGPNGAGKTTLLNAAMGLLPVDGAVRLDGDDISGLEVEERCRARALPGAGKARAVRRHVRRWTICGSAPITRRDTRLDARSRRVFERFPRLAERRRQRASTLSGGERQMLTLGRALMMRPRVLMLDEPSLGLAPLIVNEIFRAIAALRATGVSILLVEQNARAALETADYGYVLETGEISTQGDATHAVWRTPKLIASYLGEG